MTDEILETVDRHGRTTGVAPRSEIHRNPALLHKVAHVLVFNEEGLLLLQKRSLNKDVAPGKWDTSVGGHVSPGEESFTAAKREMREELGVEPGGDIAFLYSYIHSTANESELVHTYRCVHNGPFPFAIDEIDEVRFWTLDSIRKAAGSGIFSDHFEAEMKEYLASPYAPRL